MPLLLPPNKKANLPDSRFHRFIAKRGILTAMILTMTGLFAGIPLLVWLASIVIINVGTLMVLIFVCGILGLLQWRFVRQHLDLAYHQYATYAFAGFALCLLNLLLLLNIAVTVHERRETYLVQEFISTDEEGKFATALDDPALARNLEKFINGHYKEWPGGRTITIVFDTGLLGFDTISDVRFTD